MYFFNFLNLLAKLWEEGKLDLDAAIQTYVTSFPTKTFNGSTTTLTARHLLSHLGGIRHYDKTQCNKENKTNTDNKVCFLGRKGHIVIIIIVVPKMLTILLLNSATSVKNTMPINNNLGHNLLYHHKSDIISTKFLLRQSSDFLSSTVGAITITLAL